MKRARIMQSRRILSIASIALGLAITGAAAANAQKNAGSASVFSPDKGKFTVKLDGKTVGHEEFEIAASGAGWTAKGTTEIKPPEGNPTRVTGTLTLQPNGVPMAYEWSAQADKTNGAHILFANGVAKMTLEMHGARPFEQDLTFSSPLIAVLDNNLYHQYGVLARLYDWSNRGSQNFPVIIPQELTPGSITIEAVGSQSVDGKSYEALRVTTSDLEVLLFLDGSHRLMRIEVPAAKVSVVRD